MKVKDLMPGVTTDHFVDGDYIPAISKTLFAVHNPADNEELARFMLGGAEDINRAVKAARAAFENGPWPKMSIKERVKILCRFAGLVRENGKFLGMIESLTIGKLLKECISHDVERSAENIEFFAHQVEQGTEEVFHKEAEFLGKKIKTESMVSREPAGVVGIIVPWNSPLMLATWNIAPCLACANTCVVKPAPWGTLSILQLGALAQEAGIPKGVLNIVPGSIEAGDRLVRHPDVNRIAFTGGIETGKLVNKANAETRLAPPLLELGGKNPIIVFTDADFDLAIQGVIRGAFRSQGQSCVAGSRLLVERSLYLKFIYALTDHIQILKIGHQLDPEIQIGPLVTREHQLKVEDYIQSGIEEGAHLLMGGKRPDNPELKNGNYLEPAVFTDVLPEMRIWREEIFGPVLVVKTFGDEKEAVQLANNTEFGLSASIWTKDIGKAMRVASAINAGMVWVNSHFVRDLRAPFGGRKQSGSGSAGGRYSIEFYTQPRMICLSYEI